MAGKTARSPELQAQIDALYAEWHESRAKWNSARGRWYGVILKLRQVDTYRFTPEKPLSQNEIVGLRGALHSSWATNRFRWSIRRDGKAIIVERLGTWSLGAK